MKTSTQTMIAILVDLRKIRAFRIYPPGTPLSPHEGPAPIDEIRLPGREWDTDRPGRFSRGSLAAETAGMSTGMSPGERHNEESEYERRRIKEIAWEITHILDQEDNGTWCLAAPESINRRLVESIPARLRDFLCTNECADLTHATLAEIECRFPFKVPTSLHHP